MGLVNDKKYLSKIYSIKNKNNKNNKNMRHQELYEQMKQLWEAFDKEHNSTTKAGKGRARKALGELKKLVTEYRQSSVNENA